MSLSWQDMAQRHGCGVDTDLDSDRCLCDDSLAGRWCRWGGPTAAVRGAKPRATAGPPNLMTATGAPRDGHPCGQGRICRWARGDGAR